MPPSSLPDDSILEGRAEPHICLDDEQIKLLDAEEPPTGASRPAPIDYPEIIERAPPRLRITRKLLKKYGYSAGCPRCNDIDAGDHDTNKHHKKVSPACVFCLFVVRHAFSNTIYQG